MTAGVVLAAGQSRRMGRPKLLLSWGQTTVIGSVLDALLGGGVAEPLVVVRPTDLALRALLAQRRVRIVENQDPLADMLGSARCGLRALPDPVDSVLLTPADLPRLNAPLIAMMLNGFQRLSRGILVPVWQGRRGHPLIFAAQYRQEILERYDGVGLRGLLAAHPEDVTEWPAPDAAVLEDLDTPDEYWRTRLP